MSLVSAIRTIFPGRVRPIKRRSRNVVLSAFGPSAFDSLETRALLSGTVANLAMVHFPLNHALPVGSTQDLASLTFTTNTAGKLDLDMTDLLGDSGQASTFSTLKIYKVTNGCNRTLVGTLSPETGDTTVYDLVTPTSVSAGKTEFIVTGTVRNAVPQGTAILLGVVGDPSENDVTFTTNGGVTLDQNDGLLTNNVLLVGADSVGNENQDLVGDFQLITGGEVKSARSNTLLGSLTDGAVNTLGSFRIYATPGTKIDEVPLQTKICGGVVNVDTLTITINGQSTNNGLYVTNSDDQIVTGNQSFGIAHFSLTDSGVNATVGACGYVDIVLKGFVDVIDCIAIQQSALVAGGVVWSFNDVYIAGIDGYDTQLIYGGLYIGLKKKNC